MSATVAGGRATGDGVTSNDESVVLAPITVADVPEVAAFFHRGLSSGASVANWCRVMTPSWDVEQPNHGFLLRHRGRVVGAYHAFYSQRTIDGRSVRFCNLGAWSVDEQHRAAGLRMLRSLLRQRGYTFTDLTPSGNVLVLNERLGFVSLDTTTVVVPNVPWPLPKRGIRVTSDPHVIDHLLSGRDHTIYRDHIGTVAQHAVLARGDEICYVVYRKDTRRGLRVFATVLYVSDTDLFSDLAAHFYRHLLMRRGIAATIVESRVVGYRPPRSVAIQGTPKMYLSDELDARQIDYLYSELTCRGW